MFFSTSTVNGIETHIARKLTALPSKGIKTIPLYLKSVGIDHTYISEQQQVEMNTSKLQRRVCALNRKVGKRDKKI